MKKASCFTPVEIFFANCPYHHPHILGIIFTWSGIQSGKQANDQVVNQARILSRQIVLTRQWITDCGGVFVNRQSQGAKDVMYLFDDTWKCNVAPTRDLHRQCKDPETVPVFDPQDLYRFLSGRPGLTESGNEPDGFERDAIKLSQPKD